MMATGHATEVALHEFARAGQLIGAADGLDEELVAVGVVLADVADDRVDPGDTDGDVDLGLAPGAAEGVGDDDSDIVAELAEAGAQAASAGVWVDWEEDGASLGPGAGLVDAAVRADEAVACLGDEHGADLSHNALRFLQHKFDDAWLLLPTLRELLGEGGGRDGIEIDGAPLGLGDDLGGDDDDVGVGDGFAARRRRPRRSWRRDRRPR